jgi:hypothetical protein
METVLIPTSQAKQDSTDSRQRETELNAPSYLRSRGDSDPDIHLRESADHLERFLRSEHGYNYDDIFGAVAAI